MSSSTSVRLRRNSSSSLCAAMLWLTVRQSRRPPMSTIRAVTSTGMRCRSLVMCIVS